MHLIFKVTYLNFYWLLLNVTPDSIITRIILTFNLTRMTTKNILVSITSSPKNIITECNNVLDPKQRSARFTAYVDALRKQHLYYRNLSHQYEDDIEAYSRSLLTEKLLLKVKVAQQKNLLK